MNFKKNENYYLLRIKRGEEIIEKLESLAQKENLQGGFFTGIGAVDFVTFAHYSVEDKKYTEKNFEEPLEIPQISGSLGYFEDKVSVHAHAVASRKDMTTIAGHLVKARVSGTAEIIFWPAKEKIEKFYDEQTGLKLLNLEEFKE